MTAISITHPRKIKKVWIIFGLFLGILLELSYLTWYYRQPLIIKYFTERPTTHTVLSFKPNKVRLVKQGDILTGKGLPNSSVILYLTPGKYRTVLATNQDGNWLYEVPSTIDLKKYRVTVGFRDGSNKIASVKKYKIRVVESDSFSKLKRRIFKNLNIKQTNAQENAPGEPSAAIIQASGSGPQGKILTGDALELSSVFSSGKNFFPDLKIVHKWFLESLDNPDFKRVELTNLSTTSLSAVQKDPQIDLRKIPDNIKEGPYRVAVEYYMTTTEQSISKTLIAKESTPIFIYSPDNLDPSLALDENDLESKDEAMDELECTKDEQFYKEKKASAGFCERGYQCFNLFYVSSETSCSYIPKTQTSEKYKNQIYYCDEQIPCQSI